jgi:hypothetical protein
MAAVYWGSTTKTLTNDDDFTAKIRPRATEGCTSLFLIAR